MPNRKWAAPSRHSPVRPENTGLKWKRSGRTGGGNSVLRTRWCAHDKKPDWGLLRLSPLNGVLDQLGGVLEIELLFDVRAGGLDGFNAEVKFLRDLARSMA